MLRSPSRIALLGLAAAVLALGACSSKKDSLSTDTTAQPVERTETVDRAPVDQGPVPGSAEHLAQTAGDRVFFGYDRYDLSADAQATLSRQADWLKTYRNVRVTVEGHCDERGTREYNLALGERRAAAVKSYLVALGIDSARISTISYGKERPAVIGSNESSWSQNRRGVTAVN